MKQWLHAVYQKGQSKSLSPLSEESWPLKLVHQRQKSLVKNSPLGSLASASNHFVLLNHKKADYSIKWKQLINQTRERQFWLEVKRSSRIPVSSRTPEFSWNLQLHTPNSKYWTRLQTLVRNIARHIPWHAEWSSKCLLPNLSRFESNTSIFHESP